MVLWKTSFEIDGRRIGLDAPTYFIADIAANHDGDLSRAIDLIHLAAEAGADAAKFQHFSAETIVSDHGFRSLGGQLSHQASWKESVFEVYRKASVPAEWTEPLKVASDKAGITFMTSCYASDLIDLVEPWVPAYKIGSGDITYLELLENTAGKGKPVLLATGASSADEVALAVETILRHEPRLVLMQCNTNYTGSRENFRHISLQVLKTFATMYPGMPLGLSDHSPGHAAAVAAVALDVRVIEKHFTDDILRTGPDHGFSMTPETWRVMVECVRDAEAAMGSGVKKVEANECDTVVVQRRSLCARRALTAGHMLTEGDLIALRPCPDGAYPPHRLTSLMGRKLLRDLSEGQIVFPEMLGNSGQ